MYHLGYSAVLYLRRAVMRVSTGYPAVLKLRRAVMRVSTCYCVGVYGRRAVQARLYNGLPLKYLSLTHTPGLLLMY